MSHPLARREKLTISELGDELVIYDKLSEKTHCLNATSAWVWRHCDGQTSIEELTAGLHEAFGLPRSEELVRLALDQLARRQLLEGITQPPCRRSGRRDALKALAVAVAALPIVITHASKEARAYTVFDSEAPAENRANNGRRPPSPCSNFPCLTSADCPRRCGPCVGAVPNENIFGTCSNEEEPS